MRYGYFGGVFDPIHIGHLHLACFLQEAFQLDRVYFSPAYCSPHKQQNPPKASAHHRKTMVELAIQPVDRFFLWDFEWQREEISYTCLAIQAFAKAFSLKPFLLLADDALQQFSTWKRVEQLLSSCTPIVGKRTGTPLSVVGKLQSFFPHPIVAIPVLEISSHLIRERYGKNLPISHLLPKDVLDYINKNNVY